MELEHSFTVPVGIEKAWDVLLDVETIAPCMPGAALETVHGDEFTGTVKVKLGPIGLTYKGKAAFTEKDAAAHRVVIDAQGRDARGNGTAKAIVTAILTSASEDSTDVVVKTDLAITGKPAQFGRGVMVDVGNKLIGQFADCLSGKLAGTTELAPGPETELASGPAAGAAVEGPWSGDGGGRHASTETPTPAAAGETSATGAAGGSTSAAPTVTATPSAAAAPPASANGSGPSAAAAGTAAGAAGRADTAATGPRRITPTESVEPIDLMASAGPAVAKRLIPLAVAAVVALVVVLVWRRRR